MRPMCTHTDDRRRVELRGFEGKLESERMNCNHTNRMFQEEIKSLYCSNLQMFCFHRRLGEGFSIETVFLILNGISEKQPV